MFIAAGTLGLYARAVGGSRKLATLGFALALLPAVALAGTALYESLVVLSSGYPEGAPLFPPLLLWAIGMVNIAGLALLGVALLRTRALGRWSALPLAIGLLPLAAPLLLLPFVTGPGGQLAGPALLLQAVFDLPDFVGDLGWVLLGYLLWSGRPGGTARTAKDLPEPRIPGRAG